MRHTWLNKQYIHYKQDVIKASFFIKVSCGFSEENHRARGLIVSNNTITSTKGGMTGRVKYLVGTEPESE